VIVNDFKDQCTTNQDCIDLAAKQPLGPDGKPVTGLVCSDRHVCEPEKGCHSNAECQDSHNGEPYICRSSDRTCQSLILRAKDDPDTILCDVLADADDLRSESTIWLGASVFYKDDSFQGLELVRRDFNGLPHGLPPATSTAKNRRPLGFVYCEANGDEGPDGPLEMGGNHLVNDLQLPVIITSLDTTSEITLLTKYSLANENNKVFQLSTSAGGPLLKTVPNEGMLADLVLINENYPKETVELIKDYYVPLLRQAGGPLASKELPRVALIHSSTPTYKSTSTKMLLALNAANTTSEVVEFGYGDADNPSGTPAQYKSTVKDVLEFKPHVIVVLGDAEIGPAFDEDTKMLVSDGIDVPIEEGWVAAAGDQPRPQWLGILGSVGQLPEDIRGQEDPAARLDWGSRALFIQQHYDFKGPLFTDYIAQLHALLNGNDPDGIEALEGTSPFNEFLREGAYLTAYSISLLAAQGKPFTGPNVAAAARSFGSANAAKFTVGVDDIYPALQSIATTKKPFWLDSFQGWTGFDENGFATYAFADDVACVTPDLGEDGMPTIGALQPTGGIFESSGALTGTVSLTGCAAK
jgi:hypothetical protein